MVDSPEASGRLTRVLLSSSATVTDVALKRPAPEFLLGSDMRRIQERGHIRVAVQTDSPGFALKDATTGRRSGLDVYLSKLIAQSMFGGTLETAAEHVDFVDVHARDRIPICVSDEVDLVIAMLAITEDRRKHIDFTKAYFGSHLGLVARADVCADLGSARIAVVESTTGSAYAHEHNIGGDILVVENNADLLPALEHGLADAAINAIAVLDGALRHGAHDVTRVKVSFPVDLWAIGVNKNRRELQQYVDTQLAAIINAGFISSAVRSCVV